MKTLEILPDHKIGKVSHPRVKKAWQLIEQRRHWCQNANQDGDAMCAVWAIVVAYGEGPEGDEAAARLRHVVDPTKRIDLAYWNDTHSHQMVVWAMKRADV